MSTGLRLTEITPDTFDVAIGLRVRAGQESFVSPGVQSLAEAYVHSDKAWPRLILDDARVVGFLVAFFGADFTANGTGADLRSGFWRLNIAAGEQGRGHGRFAVRSVAEEIRRHGGSRLTTTWHPGAGGPEGFTSSSDSDQLEKSAEGSASGNLRWSERWPAPPGW